jgi:hypothetical protein
MQSENVESLGGAKFEMQSIHGLPVDVNTSLDIAASTHLQQRVKDWVLNESSFRVPGENLDSLKKIYNQLGSPKRIVTVIGSEWPVVWNRFGAEWVAGVDINKAQIEEYANLVTDPHKQEGEILKVHSKHLSGEWPLVLDDLTHFDEKHAREFLSESSLYLSNMCEYQTEDDFYNTLKHLSAFMSPGTHIIMSSTIRSESQNPIPSRVQRWKSLLSSDLNRDVTVKKNDELSLPKAIGEGLLDAFYVITV